MVKQILPAIIALIFLSSCAALKPLNINSSKNVVSTAVSVTQPNFIDEITLMNEDVSTISTTKKSSKLISNSKKDANIGANNSSVEGFMAMRRTATIENASSVQLKYSVLMNTEVEHLPSHNLLQGVDEWYGVKYRSGGNGKSGIDCSGFTVAVYLAVYGIALPRVSKDQYNKTRKISTTELQEGDLVFFNTQGHGVSHVGVYLGNNKFIHASVSRGVMVSSLFESYYLQRFIGAGRIDEKTIVTP